MLKKNVFLENAVRNLLGLNSKREDQFVTMERSMKL